MSNNVQPQYIIITINKVSDEFIAALYALPFDSFEEKEEELDAYILETNFDDEVKKQLAEICAEYEASFSHQAMENINWNLEWESNFDPVEIDDFVRVKADFHESKADQFTFELSIQPKMAFGTGHHQTTTMMIRSLKALDLTDKTVFDYGCGTGILAIVAEKLGAKRLVGVDNEYPAYESSVENAAINGCTKFEVVFGTLIEVAKEEFDVILANINRNILLDTGEDLVSRLKPKGTILLSGLLEQDFEIINEKYKQLGIEIIDRWQLADWICLKGLKI